MFSLKWAQTNPSFTLLLCIQLCACAYLPECLRQGSHEYIEGKTRELRILKGNSGLGLACLLSALVFSFLLVLRDKPGSQVASTARTYSLAHLWLRP
jgi:hypothetical protein